MMVSSRKERVGWYFYDWANSAFYTTVITVFLGPYLTFITENAADKSGFVHILGIPIYSGSFFPYCVSLSVLLQVFLLPLVGSLADYTRNKKLILGIFTYTGAFSTMCLYFLEDRNFLFGGIFFIIANLSFGASVVVYNSFLNDIASSEKRDSVSSIGWAMGYLGGGVLLASNLILYSNADLLGISNNHAIRISLCSAGLWWALFSLITMINLRGNKNTKVLILKSGTNINVVTAGLKQLSETFKSTLNEPQALRFILAYLLYNDGVQTVIVIASQFGAKELKLEQSFLIQVILIVQVVAFAGALVFNLISKKTGNRNAILISLAIWSICLVYAFGFLNSKADFLVLAVVIALVLGGTQALSRSLFSMLIPKDREAEYFSIYEISERGTSWVGPFLFGLTVQISHSYRLAILSLIIFFLLGFLLLYKLKAHNTQ